MSKPTLEPAAPYENLHLVARDYLDRLRHSLDALQQPDDPKVRWQNVHTMAQVNARLAQAGELLDKLNATTKRNKEPITMHIRLKKGDRIRLVSMPQDPDPIPVGSLGTVVAVHDHCDWAQVDVDWDNGRSLMLTMPDDCVAIVEPNHHEPSK